MKLMTIFDPLYQKIPLSRVLQESDVHLLKKDGSLVTERYFLRTKNCNKGVIVISDFSLSVNI